MGTNGIAAIGYLSQTLGFAALALLFLAGSRDRPLAWPLGIAAAASTLAGTALWLQALGLLPAGAITVGAEWMRYGAWIGALFAVLRSLDTSQVAESQARRIGLPVLVVVLIVLVVYVQTRIDSIPESLIIAGGILSGVVIISLLEQIYRNLLEDSRSTLKYVCVAVLCSSSLHTTSCCSCAQFRTAA